MKLTKAQNEIKIMGFTMLFLGLISIITLVKQIPWLTRLVSTLLVAYGIMHIWKVERFK